MKEFEDIPHSGGKITISSNGQVKYENSNQIPLSLHEIAVSFNGFILGRVDFVSNRTPYPSISVIMASDREGFFGYSCEKCKKYFRAFRPCNITICPYCLYATDSLNFLTENQKKYMELYVGKVLESLKTEKEICIDLDELISQLENNLLKLNSYDERQQRIIVCKECKIRFDIIGVYASCPNCGIRNNMDHFIDCVNRIREKINNSNLDLDGALKQVIDDYSGMGSDIKFILTKNIALCKSNRKEAAKIDFQKISETNSVLIKLYGLRLFSNDAAVEKFLILMFQKRHVLVHKGGIIDQKYLDKTQDTSVRLNQKITVSLDELNKFMDLLVAHSQFFFEEFSSLLSDYLEKTKKLDAHD